VTFVDAEDRASRLVGKTLAGKYRLDALLGVGGMAAVYAGVHRNGHRVAIKVLHPELAVLAGARTRFLQEGYRANAVESPSIVRVIDDAVLDDGTIFLVMELLDGETLEARRRRSDGKLPLEEVAVLVHELLDALDAAHAKGIIHRDIKPANLFLTDDGELKVLDFGIARMRDATDQTTGSGGRTLGTPAFMPREQALGYTKELDPRTDLWSVGATMFTLLSGGHVHEGETVEELTVHAATRPARSLATVSDVPSAIVEVVDRALAFQKPDRFPDARAMQAALEEAFMTVFARPMPARSQTRKSKRAPASSVGRDDDAKAHVEATVFGAPVAAAFAAPIAPERRRRTRTREVAVATALLGCLLLVFARSGGRSTPVAASTSASAPAPEPAPSLAPAPEEPPSVAAPAPPASSSVPAITSVARPVKRALLPVAAPAASSAGSCDPPYYYDPNDRGRKVKPGCS
jgi:serine/threonine-protein kinase